MKSLKRRFSNMKVEGVKIRTKNPAMAVFLSLLIWPGSGNIYNERFRHGFIWIATAVGGWMLYIIQLGVFIGVLVSIYVFAASHAYKQARKINVFRTGSPKHIPGELISMKTSISNLISRGREIYDESKR